MADERRYWDSGCFIAVLAREAGRFATCEPLLRAAALRRIEIVTSALTIAEVLYPQKGTKLDAAHRATVKTFFRHKGILLSEVDRTIAESAQEYVWDFNVRPKDAIHVASAIDAKVPILETYDTDLIKLSGRVGGDPLLEIRLPQPLVAPASKPPPQRDLLSSEAGDGT